MLSVEVFELCVEVPEGTGNTIVENQKITPERKQIETNKTENRDDATKLAPGLDGVEGLESSATPHDIADGNTTQVTTLVYDEYDPSGDI